MLNIIESIPDGLLSLSASELHTLLSGPTLVHLIGRREPAMFVSVLLHGNEHSGWEAIKKLLNDYSRRELPRSLSIFIGNVQAAKYNKRFLDEQQDYNRVWDGGETPEHEMMQQIKDEMERRGCFLSIDVHNNTGKNPHYACVNKTYNEFLHVATLFSRTVVYFIRPKGVQSMAFAELCSAITVECGTSGETSGIDHACSFINACLNLDELPNHAVDVHDIDLYHTIATVKIPAEYNFSFNQTGDDLLLDDGIEMFNFSELPVGTVIGKVRNGIENPLEIRDEQGNEVSHQYFSVENGGIISRQTVVPAMITLDTDIIRKDCFCYLMERYPLS